MTRMWLFLSGSGDVLNAGGKSSSEMKKGNEEGAVAGAARSDL